MNLDKYLSGLDPIAIWTGGSLGRPGTKTANALLTMGRRWDVSSVVDHRHQGMSIANLVEGADGVPIVASLAEAKSEGAKSVVFGLNFLGASNEVPSAVREVAIEALRLGMNVVASSHVHLNDDGELRDLARRFGLRLVDVRIEGDRVVWRQPARLEGRPPVLLTVGTDCAVGKMTTALSIHREAQGRGARSAFVATGQIGTMCGSDASVHVDHTLAEFIPGAVQQAIEGVLRKSRDLVVVEGQQCLLHRAGAGGVVDLLYGCEPDYIVMCHEFGRERRAMYPDLAVSSLSGELEAIDVIARGSGIRPELLAVSAYGDWSKSREGVNGVPLVDVRRGGAPKIVDALCRALRTTRLHQYANSLCDRS